MTNSLLLTILYICSPFCFFCLVSGFLFYKIQQNERKEKAEFQKELNRLLMYE